MVVVSTVVLVDVVISSLVVVVSDVVARGWVTTDSVPAEEDGAAVDNDVGAAVVGVCDVGWGEGMAVTGATDDGTAVV